MLGFLFFVVILILVIGLFVVMTVFGFIRSIFSLGRRREPMQNDHSEGFEEPSTKKKIFEKQDGEYVDFEEVE